MKLTYIEKSNVFGGFFGAQGEHRTVNQNNSLSYYLSNINMHLTTN